MRVALSSSLLCLVAYLQLASAAVLPRNHPSTQVTACRNALRSETAFCKLWLHGQTRPRSTVATATTTKLVQGPPVRVTTTPSITKTQTTSSVLSLTATTQTTTTLDVETATTITSTSIATSTITEATATETDYDAGFHERSEERRRSNGVTKLKAVQQYSNDVITEACEYILYGTDGPVDVTKTLTSTSTQAGRSITVTARPAKTTTTSTKTVSSTVSTETDVSTVTSATGTSTSTSVVDTTTVVTQVIASTSTVNVPAPTPDMSCGNQGINWAYYHVPSLENTDLSSIDSTQNYQSVKSSQPDADGTSSDYQSYSFSAENSDFWQPYSDPNYEYTYDFYLDTTTYFFAQFTGTYYFILENSNDQAVGWIESPAYSGWTNSNRAFSRTSTNAPQYYVTLDLVAGSYTPLRIIWAQSEGLAGFFFTILDEQGNELVGNGAATDPLLVRFSCDGTAPAFPAWGSET